MSRVCQAGMGGAMNQEERQSIPPEEHPEHKLRHALMLIGALLLLAEAVKYLMAM